MDNYCSGNLHFNFLKRGKREGKDAHCSLLLLHIASSSTTLAKLSLRQKREVVEQMRTDRLIERERESFTVYTGGDILL